MKSTLKLKILLPPSLPGSHKKFSLLSAIQFIRCYFGEVGTTLTNNTQLIFFFIRITCLPDIVMIL